MRIILYISILQSLNVLNNVKAESDWIDPFSLDGTSLNQFECQECNCKQASDADFRTLSIYYKRNINLLLNILVKNIESRFKYDLSIDLSPDEYKVLKTFAKESTLNLEDLPKIDEVLSNIFSISARENLVSLVLSWKEYFMYIIFTHEVLFIVCTLLVLIVIWAVIKGNISLTMILKFFLVAGFVIDFVHTAMHMMQKKELDRMMELKYNVPDECDVSKMTWIQYLSYSFEKEKCKKYHEAAHINVFWSVGPGAIIGEQFGNFIIKPAEKTGQAIGLLFENILKESSWYTKMAIVATMPVIILCLFMGVCMILSLICGRIFEFNLFHFIKFKFGIKNDQPLAQSNPPQPISSPEQKVLKDKDLSSIDNKAEEITRRKTIEDVVLVEDCDEAEEAILEKEIIETK